MNWINKYLEVRLRYTTNSDNEKNKEVMKINEKLIPDRETLRVTSEISINNPTIQKVQMMTESI
jgi:hypothetical protein